MNEPQYTPEQLEKFKEDNKKGVTYNGRHYTSYEATQKQRQIERAIRRQKRRVLVAESSGDKDALLTSQIKLRRLNEEYERYSNAVGLPTQRERAQVGGFGAAEATDARTAASRYYKEWSKSIGVKDSVKTLEDYYEMKYNRPEEYRLLRKYSNAVQTGIIPAQTTFTNYLNIVNVVDSKLVGIKTSNGIDIKGYVTHFIERIIGTAEDKTKGNKPQSGVPVEDILNALLYGDYDDVSLKSTKTGEKKRSQTFFTDECQVSVNPDTGEMTQCTPFYK